MPRDWPPTQDLPHRPPPPTPPPEPVLPEIAEALVVRPGDTLIVRYERALTAADGQRVKDKLSERLPGVDVLVIGCQQLAVYRPGSAGEQEADHG